MNQQTYVYLLQTSISKKYKIGRTKNDPTKRLKQLQTGSSEEIVLIDFIQTIDSARLESALHQTYRHYRIGKTEWFDFSNEKALEHFLQCWERLKA